MKYDREILCSESAIWIYHDLKQSLCRHIADSGIILRYIGDRHVGFFHYLKLVI